MKYHSLGGIHFFLTILEASCQDHGVSGVGLFQGLSPWLVDWLSSPCVFTWSSISVPLCKFSPLIICPYCIRAYPNDLILT